MVDIGGISSTISDLLDRPLNEQQIRYSEEGKLHL